MVRGETRPHADPMNADTSTGHSRQRGSGTRPPGSRRRLYRSSDDRIISGVAGGVAEYFDIDPVIVRIALVVLTLAGGAGFVGYIAAWVLLPERDGSVAWSGGRDWIDGRRGSGRVDARQLGAIALVGIGAVMLLDRIGIGVDGGIAWPVALIGGGAAVLWGQRNRSEEGHDDPDSPTGRPHGGSGGADEPGGSGGPDGPVGPQPNGSGGGAVVATAAPSTEIVVPDTELRTIAPAVEQERIWDGTWNDEAQTSAALGASPLDEEEGAQRPRRRGRARRRAGRAGRTPFARAALGLFVALTGAVLLAARLGALDGTADRRADRPLAVLLISIGAVLTLGAWLGRPRGFVAAGLLTGAALIASSTLDVSWQGGFGERVVTASATNVKPAYRLTAGTLHLDLSRVDMRHQRLRVATEVSLGRLLVEVPNDVKVVVAAKAGAGHLVIFGTERNGPSIERSATEAGSTEAAGTLYLDTKVGLGELEVARVGHVITKDWGTR